MITWTLIKLRKYNTPYLIRFLNVQLHYSLIFPTKIHIVPHQIHVTQKYNLSIAAETPSLRDNINLSLKSFPGRTPMYAECINPPNDLFVSGELYQYSQPGEDYEIYVSDYYTLLLTSEQFDYYFRQV